MESIFGTKYSRMDQVKFEEFPSNFLKAVLNTLSQVLFGYSLIEVFF